jgi:hypothetical protein
VHKESPEILGSFFFLRSADNVYGTCETPYRHSSKKKPHFLQNLAELFNPEPSFPGLVQALVYIYSNIRAIRRVRKDSRWCPDLDLNPETNDVAAPAYDVEELAEWWTHFCQSQTIDHMMLPISSDEDSDEEEEEEDEGYVDPPPSRGTHLPPPISAERQREHRRARMNETDDDTD